MGVTRQNLPNMTMERPFYFICGMLVFVIAWQSLYPSEDDKGTPGRKTRKKKGPSMRRPKAESQAGGAAAARDKKKSRMAAAGRCV